MVTRTPFLARQSKTLLMAGLLSAMTSAAQAQTISKVFTPNTIGPGAVSTITITITNPTGSALTGLAFTDVLPTVPGDVDIADPSNASTTCDLGISGTLTAPDGGSTISLADARLGAASSCTVTVDVTASTPGVHTNPAIPLTYDGLVGAPPESLPVDLTVVTTRPGFSKSFAPSSVSLGEKSTLTFTIDNTLNAAVVGNLDFTDNLPAGMVVADPANAVTDCIAASAPDTDLTAVPGTSLIDLDASGSTFFPGFEVLPIGATCTVTVDVTTTGTGMLDNITSDLLADFTSAGKASDTLEVTVTPLAIQKDFTDDPTPPGNSVTLEFTLTNFDRIFSATGVAFTDDLTTVLAGLTFSSLLSNDCGGSVSGVGGTTIGLSGGTLAPESSCTIRVSLSVPGGATPGAYTNTTSTITATIDGSPVVGTAASADLFVEPVPILTKEFLEVGTLAPNPVVNPGDDVVLRFTVTNTSTTSGATDVAFADELTNGGPGTGFLPFPLSVTPTPPIADPCGVGSSLSFFFPDSERQGLQLTGGSLAAAPGAGATCTFDVTLTIPTDFAAGVYTNTTGDVTATVDGATRTGDPASDTLTVIAGPSLSKTFLGDPVAPGGTVTLEFTLELSANSPTDATGITFTDDLAAVVPALVGLTASVPPTPDPPCGAGSTLTASAGDTLLTLMGGTLMPGTSCTFSVTVDVPMGAASNTYVNTTSGVGSTISGTAVTSLPASDDLVIGGMVFNKEFIGDPAFPGEALLLRFTLENISDVAATGIGFTDSLFSVANLEATDPALVNDCGGTLTILTIPGFGSNLTYAAGTLAAGATCTVDVEVTVPATASDGTFENNAGNVSYFLGATPGSDGPAIDSLIVESDQLLLTKAFTDDPVAPGDSVTLEFTLSSLDTDNPASLIDFTDDLSTLLPGATFDSEDFNDCGAAVGGLGTDILSVTGASLAIGGSCTLRISLTVPGGTLAGLYVNTTSTVTGEIAGSPVSGDPATDPLEVIQTLDFSKSFDGPTTATGMATLTFTITNPGAETASGIGFTDDLNAVIPGLIAISLPAVPCGAGSSITGIGFLTFSGGELPPLGGMCTFDVDVLVPGTATAGTFPNTTSDLFQNGLEVADPATADLTIEPPPTFAKVFTPDFIGFGQNSTLTFTIDNTASALAASSLAFTDTLPAGIAVATPSVTNNTCGGTLTAVAAGGSISLAGGSVGAGATCTIDVDVTGNAVGALVNLTGDLTSTSGNSGTTTDTLTVNPQPGFAKAFAPDPILVGGTSTLTFTIDNSASTVAASLLAFVDNLPAAIVNATPANVVNSCGGTVTAADGGASITLAGGTVAVGSLCTITVDVTSATAGTHTNLSGNLTSSLGTSGTATDTLTVNPPPGFAKSFAPNPIAAGFTSTLTFTIDNSGSTVDATGLAFTDNLPAAIVNATPANSTNTCGGTLTAADGGSVISLTGGAVTTGATCTITVEVTSTTAGDHVNLTGDLTSSLGNSGTATDTLRVNPQPGFTKSFAPNPTIIGELVALTFTIDNTASTVDATALDFTDNLPAALTVATPSGASTTCTGGTITAVSGTSVISYSGGTVATGATCQVVVDVVSSAAGDHVNLTGDLTSSLGNSGTATDTLTVNPPPIFSKAFAPDTIAFNGISTLTFTIDNTASTVDATSLVFDDNMPAAITIATPSGAGTTCTGGTLTAVPGTSLIGYVGGTVAAGATCTISVDVTSSTAGAHVNTSDELGSSLGLSGMATDTLTVDPPPTFAKAFAPNPIVIGGTSTLTFTIDNSASTSAATALDFTDNLPAEIVNATPANAVNGCGGTLTAADGGSVISLTGGTVGAAATCTIMVDVTSSTAGAHVNLTGDLTSSLGNSGTATDTLTVDPPPTFAKAFAPDTIPAGTVSTLTFTIDNSGSITGATALDFTDNLPAEIVIATPANAVNGCGGTVTAADGGSVISLTGGTVGAGATCTIDVDVTSSTLGAHVNLTGDLTSSLGNSGTATDTLTVNLAPGFSKVFTPDAIAAGFTSTLTFTIDNSTSTQDATALDFTDNLPVTVVVATPAVTANTCGGTLTAVAGSSVISLTGGTVTAMSTCTVSVDVTSAAPGTYTNLTGDLTSSLGNSGTATDDLTVDPQPGFSKVFAPNPISLGGVSTLTFSIDNTGSTQDATGLDFTDNLPAGLVVATPSGATTDCTGGTLTAVSGSGVIAYSGGSVATLASCTVSVDTTTDASGTYVNTSGDLTSSLGNSGSASDTLEVLNGELTMTKTFVTEPVLPGGNVELEYTISNNDRAFTATEITFTDDLDAVIPGLVAVGLDAGGDVCGLGSQISGTSVITLTDGTLDPMTSCTFTVTLLVPADAIPGIYPSASSLVSGNFSGATVLGPPAEADLVIEFLGFTKAFLGSGAAGGTVDLEFTITNPDPVNAANDITFTDDLEAVLPGLEAIGLPLPGVCGAGSEVSGTSIITLTGGTLGGGEACIFVVTLQIPASAPNGDFTNITSALSATVGGQPVIGDPAGAATADLSIENLIEIPTLNVWGILLLVGLLALAAIRRLRWA
ncbi:MAG: IPTL-CTERM sorting domain-containing protein [Acidobacteriota bacterium]